GGRDDLIAAGGIYRLGGRRALLSCERKMGPQAWLPLRRPLRAFPDHCTLIGIMLLLRLAMIQTEPVMTSKTISTPNARARILFVLSGPVRRCRKKTRWTPICAKASTSNPTGIPGGHSKLVCATTKEAIVATIASTRPTVYDR